MDTLLRDQHVLITGASGGIGQATARAFAAEGAGVALHYHTHGTAAAELAGELAVPSVTVKADLRDEEQTAAVFAEVRDVFPRIDAIVVNAGIWTAEAIPLHEMSLEHWRATMEADLTSAFLSCRAFLRHLADVRRESASIVLVGSTAALFGEADHADYSAAKAGMVHGLTLSLKNEIARLAPRGRVNCVCPGWTATPMAAPQMADPAVMKRVFATMPLRKVATAEDVANAIVFLSSDALAGHISGAIVPLAGGMEGRVLSGGGA